MRILTSEIVTRVGETVELAGWVNARRDQGKIIFIDLRDRSGIVQVVFTPKNEAVYPIAKNLRGEWVIKIVGTVKERPEAMVNPNIKTGKYEIQVTELKVLAKAEPLPFDLHDRELNLELTTQLDHRALLLRHPRLQAIFKVQAVIIDSFREFLKSQDFFEFQAPSITPATAEGGAEVFQIGYFDKKAYLTQSPQLYKQIVMTAFERVFSVNKIFRAEPSATTRHLTEIVSLDAEMGFIDSWKDVRDMSENTVRHILRSVEEKCAEELKLLGATLPKMIDYTPTYSLTEAQEKIFGVMGRDVRGEKDLNPEDERAICEIVKKETGSDFVYIYGYPTRQKPFYVYPNPEKPEFNEGMDLLCRGLEWLSGGRRVNDYEELMKHVKEWKMDPTKIEMFLEAFRYGAPPEGGFALGAERMTMQILELANVREASMFPRDMNRIDKSLNE